MNVRACFGAIIITVSLAGCGAPRAVAPLPPQAPALQPPALVCLDTLTKRGAVYEPVADQVVGNGCGLTNGVVLTSLSARMEPRAAMTCPLALALLDFDHAVVQPIAAKHFGQPVRAIRQFGAYSCRVRMGSGKLSTHAFGQAIDIAAFELNDGARVTVKEHWRDPGPRGRFLREIARLACERFNVVLTPNTDAAHADHFHFDIGPDRLCGA